MMGKASRVFSLAFLVSFTTTVGFAGTCLQSATAATPTSKAATSKATPPKATPSGSMSSKQPSTSTTPTSAAPTSTSPASTPILRLGSRGEAVKQLQRLLKTAGVYTGSADGIFGAQTEAAVIKLQRAKKLAVDGVVGAKTWAALHG